MFPKDEQGFQKSKNPQYSQYLFEVEYDGSDHYLTIWKTGLTNELDEFIGKKRKMDSKSIIRYNILYPKDERGFQKSKNPQYKEHINIME